MTAARMKRWSTRDCALVRFRDDPALLHWRGVLLCKNGDLCTVITPDRDIEDSELKVGEVYQEIRRYDDGRLPRTVRERDTYLPKHSSQGVFTDEEMRKFVLNAERAVDAARVRRRVTGRREEHREEGLAGEPVAAPEDVGDGSHDFGWLVVYRSGGGLLGETVEVPGDAADQTVNGRVFRFFSRGGEEILAKKVPWSEVGQMQRVFAAGRPEVPSEERDVRILPVLFDSADERYRTMAEAEIDFDDFPLQGPRAVSHDVRTLRRMGLDFLLHHEAWLKKSGVRTSDRSVHEHSAICRALHFMVTYDQLNLPALASAEAMNRRRALIEHAHSGRPDAPSYEGAEDFLGIKDCADGSVVDPALTQHAARRQAAKAEVLKQTRLATEERRNAGKKGDPKGDGKGNAAKQAASNP